MIVGAHDQNGVFDGNNEDKGPEDQRYHAKHRIVRSSPARARCLDRFLERVERTGPDISEYHPHACQRRRSPRGPARIRSSNHMERIHQETPPCWSRWLSPEPESGFQVNATATEP